MMIFKSNTLVKILILGSCLFCSACVGTVIGTVVDATIEVAKVPFKVGGAIIDVASDDEEFDESRNSSNNRQAADITLEEQVSF